MSQPDRIPPADLDAECAVLSAVMLDKLAMDKLASLQPEHFYSEANRRIFEAARALHAVGQPVDIVQVGTWLKTKDRIGQVGGMAYLTEVLNAAPAVAHVDRYGKTVTEKFRVRAIIAAAQRIEAQGYIDHGDAKEFCDNAEAAMHAIAREVTGGRRDTFAHVSVPVRAAFEEVAKATKSSGVTGTPTGLRDLDMLLTGLHGGESYVLAGRPGMGKAHPLTTRVLTPTGWRQIGGLCAGDRIIGSDGQPHTVLATHDRGELDVFRVSFDDGGSVECCDDHLWATRTRTDRRNGLPAAVRSMRDIRATLRVNADRRTNHSVQYVRPVEFAPVGALPLDPYVLGAWLGDGDFCRGGTVRMTNEDLHITDRVEFAMPDSDMMTTRDALHYRFKRKQRTAERSGMATALAGLGLEGCGSSTKFVPEQYLRAPVADRIELLRGIFDTDGYVTDPHGACIELSTCSERLAEGVAFLVMSLGGRVTSARHIPVCVRDGERTNGTEAHRMCITFPAGDFVPVTLPAKVAKYRAGTRRLQGRFMTEVEYSRRAECRCITVSAPDSLYVTEDFIVTHNSALGFGIGGVVAASGLGVVGFSEEMPARQVALRMTCSEAGVGISKARAAQLNASEWDRLTAAAKRVSQFPYWVDDKPGTSIPEIRSGVRRAERECAKLGTKLGLVVVDYLQLTRFKGAGSREQEISEISRAMKELAKDFDVPVLALSQLNRGVESRADKRPMMSDLRESGAIEQDADAIIFVYRDKVYDKDSAAGDTAELIVAKQRNGPTGTVQVFFEEHTTTFRDLSHEHAQAGGWR